MIDRRRCTFGAFGVLAWTAHAGAHAATTPRRYRIGVLDPNAEVRADTWNEFVAELRRRGWNEGRELVFERRRGDESNLELLNRNAAALAQLKVDLIYAVESTLSALAAKAATRTIPVVFNSSADPVGFGIVASLARPGGNLTGNSISGFDTIPKSVQLLTEAAGRSDLRIVAFQPAGTRALAWFSKLSATVIAAAERLGARFEFVDVASIDELEATLKRLVREGIGAVSMDFASPFFADKILRGAKPADLPVEQATAFELRINLKTANAIGLRIPQSMQMRAAALIR